MMSFFRGFHVPGKISSLEVYISGKELLRNTWDGAYRVDKVIPLKRFMHHIESLGPADCLLDLRILRY